MPVRANSGPGSRYSHAVGLLVEREGAFEPRRLLSAFEEAREGFSIELPRDLPWIDDWPRAALDGDRFEHRVGLAVVDGGIDLLEHFCADTGRGHEPPGHHSWGDGGHETDDLVYSLLAVRYGGPFRPGWRREDPAVPAMLYPGLFAVVARLSRGHAWRMQWDRLDAITTERNAV